MVVSRYVSSLGLALATAALARGKDVLLETPMAPTVEGCDRLLAAAGHGGGVRQATLVPAYLITLEPSAWWIPAPRVAFRFVGDPAHHFALRGPK